MHHSFHSRRKVVPLKTSDNLNNKIVMIMEILSLHVPVERILKRLMYLEFLCVLAIGIHVTL